MSHDEIRAVLFDLGDTILNFGRIKPTRAFLAGARASYGFLTEQGQYRGGLPWYFLSNLVRLRAKYVISNLLQRDFNSLELLQAVGARKGVELSRLGGGIAGWRSGRARNTTRGRSGCRWLPLRNCSTRRTRT